MFYCRMQGSKLDIFENKDTREWLIPLWFMASGAELFLFFLLLCAQILCTLAPQALRWALQGSTTLQTITTSVSLDPMGMLCFSWTPRNQELLITSPWSPRSQSRYRQPRHGNREKAHFSSLLSQLLYVGFFQLYSGSMLLCHTAKFRFLTQILRGKIVFCFYSSLVFCEKRNIQNILTIGKVFMKRQLAAWNVKYFDNQTLQHFHLNMILLPLHNNIVKQNWSFLQYECKWNTEQQHHCWAVLRDGIFPFRVVGVGDTRAKHMNFILHTLLENQ